MLEREYKDAQFSKNEQMRNMAMNAGMLGQCDAPTKRHSAAEEVGELIERVSSLACEVAQITASKLSPIMRDCGPEEANKAECERSIPPYFQHLRLNIQAIEYQLRSIADYIQRTDI